MKIKFLGTGANGGLPQVDCGCGNCKKAREGLEKIRLRSCLLVETEEKKIVLDCGPDFRQQMLNENLELRNLDLIVVTHLHWDHVGGLMELSVGKSFEVPVLVSEKNRKVLMARDEIKFMVEGKFIKLIDEVEGLKIGVELFEVPHDPNFSTDAVIVCEGDKRIWYSPDVVEITDEMMEKLEGVDQIIFDATFLNEEIFPAKKFNHVIVEKSAPRLVKLGKEVIFSHVNHSEDLEKMKFFLGKFGFKLAEDGLSVKI